MLNAISDGDVEKVNHGICMLCVVFEHNARCRFERNVSVHSSTAKGLIQKGFTRLHSLQS